MKAIQFLFDLREKHTFFINGVDDAQTLIEMFTPEVFDANFKEQYGGGANQFLCDLKKDALEMNFSEIESLFPMLYVGNSDNRSVVLDILLDGIKRYIVCHIRDFPSLKKYRKVILASLVRDMENDLHFGVHYSFTELNFDAGVQDFLVGGRGNHSLYISLSDHEKSYSNAFCLYSYFFQIYHEQYHCLVAEADYFSNTYNLDLLEFIKLRKYTKILDENSKTRQGRLFYTYNYENNHEEAQANFYAMEMAFQKLKEISPSFPVQKISFLTSMDQAFYKESRLNLFFKTLGNQSVRQETFLNEELDHLLIKYPSYVSGMLTKVYRSDGNRKEFQELLQDRETLFTVDKDSKEEIEIFYAELLYQALEKLSLEDIIHLALEEGLEAEIRNCFLHKIDSIKQKIKNLKISKSGIYLFVYFSKKIAKIHYTKDLKDVYKKYNLFEAKFNETLEQKIIK